MSGVIPPASSGSSGLVDEPNFSQIRINLNIEYGDCRFEMNDQGRYVIHIEGNANLLTTNVCEYSRYLPQLLAKGGTVMAVCYGLYKLGFSAGNFSRGSLEFELKVEPAKMATIRRQITKGTFAELLQDEVEAIIEEHQSTLPNLKKFTIQSAKEVIMTETAKQSGLVFGATNLNQKEPVSHAGNHTHRSIRITNEFSCNPEWTSNLELHQGKYFIVVNGQRVELKTELWPLEKGLKQLLYCGGAPVLICYGLFKLGYDASEFTCEGAGFKIKPRSTSQIEEIQWLLRCGRFAHKLGSEICKIIEEHSDILGNVNFTITSCSEVQEPLSNPSGNSDPIVDRGTLSSDAFLDNVQDTGYGASAPSIRDVGEDTPATPAETQSDAVPVTNQPDDNKTSKPFQYHVGIFAHDHDKEKADRIKGYCDSLEYNTCIYSKWVVGGGEPLAKKVVAFIKECLVLFWIASPQPTVGSYMDYWKIVAHDISIKSKISRFVVVIPKEYLQHPKEEILPAELIPYDPVEEDTMISERIKATVETVQASTPNPPAVNDSQIIPTISGPPTDVPGPSITNIIHIHDSSFGSLVLQGQRESDSKSKEE